MTARAIYKRADVQRAIGGVLAAGLPVTAVEFTAQGFTVIVGTAEQRTRPNPLDRLYGISPPLDPSEAARQTASMLKRLPRK